VISETENRVGWEIFKSLLAVYYLKKEMGK